MTENYNYFILSMKLFIQKKSTYSSNICKLFDFIRPLINIKLYFSRCGYQRDGQSDIC